jgi:alpha-amylase
MPNYKRLKFFDKDPIEWTGLYELHGFYRTLLTLRKTNPALRAADPAVTTHRLHTTFDDKCFAFARRSGDDQVVVILNLSNQKITLPMSQLLLQGAWQEVFTGSWCDCNIFKEAHLPPWGYLVLEKQRG